MPITTTVSRSDVRESQTVTGGLTSVPGPGFDPRTIELRWRVQVPRQGEAFGFEVTLGCKRGASGTTCFAWTFASDVPTGAPDEWAAWIGSYRHEPRHRCQ